MHDIQGEQHGSNYQRTVNRNVFSARKSMNVRHGLLFRELTIKETTNGELDSMKRDLLFRVADQSLTIFASYFFIEKLSTVKISAVITASLNITYR